MDGYGLYTWPSGKQYEGHWENGKQHGTGIFINASGEKKKGEWINGKREKWVE